MKRSRREFLAALVCLPFLRGSRPPKKDFAKGGIVNRPMAAVLDDAACVHGHTWRIVRDRIVINGPPGPFKATVYYPMPGNPGRLNVDIKKLLD